MRRLRRRIKRFKCADGRRARSNVLRKHRLSSFLSGFFRMPSLFYRGLDMSTASGSFLHNTDAKEQHRNLRLSMLQSSLLSKENVATDVTHTWLRQYVFLFVVLLRKYAFLYTRFEYTLSNIFTNITFLESASLSAKICSLRNYPKTHLCFLSYVASLLFSTISSMWQSMHSYSFFLDFHKASVLRILTKHPSNAFDVVSDAVVNKLVRFFFLRLRLSLLQFCFVDLYKVVQVHMYYLFVVSFKNVFYFLFNSYCTTKYCLQRDHVTHLFLHSDYVN